MIRDKKAVSRKSSKNVLPRRTGKKPPIKAKALDASAKGELSDLQEAQRLELRKLPEQTKEMRRYDMLRFIASDDEKEMAMLAKKSPTIGKVYAALQKMSRNKSIRRLAEAREKELLDQEASIEYGRQEGRAMGRAEMSRAVVHNALRDGLPLPKIAKLTGLPLDQVKRIAAEELEPVK